MTIKKLPGTPRSGFSSETSYRANLGPGFLQKPITGYMRNPVFFGNHLWGKCGSRFSSETTYRVHGVPVPDSVQWHHEDGCVMAALELENICEKPPRNEIVVTFVCMCVWGLI